MLLPAAPALTSRDLSRPGWWRRNFIQGTGLSLTGCIDGREMGGGVGAPKRALIRELRDESARAREHPFGPLSAGAWMLNSVLKRSSAALVALCLIALPAIAAAVVW